MTKTSYPTDYFSVVVHNDVLEHIYDYRAALRENHRILEPGGVLLFTAPFFPTQRRTIQLARIADDGSIVHLVDPPEYHGDNISDRALAFARFGWDVLDEMRTCGFQDAFIALAVDPFSGLVTNNCPIADGNMPALAVIGLK